MEPIEGRKIYTVSELNGEIKAVLEDTYPGIWVEGEVFGLKTYASGHTYFFLKDNDSQISAVLFKGFGKFSLEEGMKILARGKVSAYPKRGDYQIIVNFVEPAGLGALQIAFEELKEKLRDEGLFDEARKRRIPLLAGRIGIVTSPDGAALRDILTVIERRFANVEILIYPARVQGDEAKFEIAAGIQYLNSNYPQLDVLIVGRGGGSYQDLWAFNEEIVARAIYGSMIPVISCVGHEVDFTIADFVADLRAPTPSAAAELVVQNKSEIIGKIEGLNARLSVHIGNVIKSYDDKLAGLSRSPVLRKPGGLIELQSQRVDELSGLLQGAAKSIMENKYSNFTHASEKLNLVSPLNVLSRGYSICSKAGTGRALKDSAALKPGDCIDVRLNKGRFSGIVKETALS